MHPWFVAELESIAAALERPSLDDLVAATGCD